MGFRNFHIIFHFIFAFLLAEKFQVCLSLGSCDFYQGNWVYDNSLPQYTNKTCPFIRKFINCQGNGRPDTEYQKYKWQPNGCKLSRFNGLDFLEKLRGKRILFVGDSLSNNQHESLVCLLYSSTPNLKYRMSRIGGISYITFLDYDLKVSMDVNHYFVDIIQTPTGRALTLDSIQDGINWHGYDVLIFNTWHWWFYVNKWDYVKDGNKIYKDGDRMYLLQRALGTWAKWVDANVHTNKTKVFFQGISPNHYHGKDWGKPKENCLYQQKPLLKYGGPDPMSDINLIKNELKKMKTPVSYLDVTHLSLLRKDGHPSMYGQHAPRGDDCTHWCLSGVPDTWNQILYNIMISPNQNNEF